MSAQHKKENRGYTKNSLNLRAAEFYRGIRKPEDQWKDINDLTSPLSEFPHLVKAGEYDRAFRLIEEIEPYLMVWGYYNKLAEMRGDIVGKLDEYKELLNKGNIGKTYVFVGRGQEARELLEEARDGVKKKNDSINEGRFIGWYGLAVLFTGRASEAFEICNQARVIAEENNDKLYEAWWLVEIGWLVLEFMGNFAGAVAFCEQSDRIYKELEKVGQLDIWGRASKELNNSDMGHAYSNIGHDAKAVEILKRAIDSANDIGDRLTVIWSQGAIGNAYRNLFQADLARDHYNKGLESAEKFGLLRYVTQNLIHLGNLHRDQAFYQDISGKKEEALDYLRQAAAAYEKGLDMEKQIGSDPLIRISYSSLGNVRSSMGEKEAEDMFHLAHESFEKALEIAGPDKSILGYIQLDMGRNQLRAVVSKADKFLDAAYTYFKDAHDIHAHQASFGLGAILLQAPDEPKFKTIYTDAGEAFNKSLEECEKRIRALKDIEIKQKAELQYLRTASLAGLAAAASGKKRKKHLEDAKEALESALNTYKSPDLLRDIDDHLRQVRRTSGEEELVDPLLALAHKELQYCLDGAPCGST